MKPRQKKPFIKLFRIFLLLAALVMALAGAGRAATEDVAMFYEELLPYGNWVDYGNYGPVWYPTRVTENWRPYLDGRWVPTDSGWVFETTEPWGWATYHYGNWMPTEDYGWVWVPGSTWYPSTAAWRTSDDYIGWAPIPPPNYVPPPAYYPPGGYYPGMPILDLITAPFWILARAASFLLGFGLPYSPTYSYYNCGCLAPFDAYPMIFPRTYWLYDYCYPTYAPGAYFFFGPSFPFVSRVCNVPIVRINTFVREVRINHIRHALPPRSVLDRRPFLRKAIPEAVLEGRRLEVRRVEDARRVQRLARPDVVRPPREGLPKVPRIERVTPEMRPRPEGLRPERGRPGVPERARPEGFRPGAEKVIPERARPEVLRPAVPERRGLRLPPPAVPEEREMREQLRQQRRLEQRVVPREQLRQFQRQEQELRRQEIFRPPRVTRPEPFSPRIERFQPQRIEPRPAPQFRPQPSAPRGGEGFRGGPEFSPGRGGGHR